MLMLDATDTDAGTTDVDATDAGVPLFYIYLQQIKVKVTSVTFYFMWMLLSGDDITKRHMLQKLF